jgi:hypothetical protein
VNTPESSRARHLALEQLAAEHRAQIRLENLEQDAALELDIASQVVRGHAAAAELALDRVTSLQRVAHLGRPMHDPLEVDLQADRRAPACSPAVKGS